MRSSPGSAGRARNLLERATEGEATAVLVDGTVCLATCSPAGAPGEEAIEELVQELGSRPSAAALVERAAETRLEHDLAACVVSDAHAGVGANARELATA